MQITIAAVALFCLALSTQAFADKEARDAAPLQHVEGTLKFDLYQNYLMVVKGSVGRLKGLTFVIDTGASPSILDPLVAQKLHLPQSSASIKVVGGSVQAGAAIAPSLGLGPVTRENVPVLIEDLSFYEKVLPMRVDGVIGVDVLGQDAFLIDYGASKIQFGFQGTLGTTVPLYGSDGLAFIDAGVNEQKVRMLVDTGAPSLLLFNQGFPGAVHELRASTKVPTSANIGEFAQKQVRLQSLKLGQTDFGRTPANVVQDRTHTFDGIISLAGLGLRKVAIDLSHGEMSFSR